MIEAHPALAAPLCLPALSGCEAHQRAFCPNSSTALGLAPASSSTRTASSHPLNAAAMRSVQPPLEGMPSYGSNFSAGAASDFLDPGGGSTPRTAMHEARVPPPRNRPRRSGCHPSAVPQTCLTASCARLASLHRTRALCLGRLVVPAFRRCSATASLSPRILPTSRQAPRFAAVLSAVRLAGFQV